jgi:hypothetical protein
VEEDNEMPKYTIILTDKQAARLQGICDREEITKAQAVRRAITLLAKEVLQIPPENNVVQNQDS